MTFAYRNLQVDDVQWFIRAGRKGKVLGSRRYVMLARATFFVDQEARKKDLREGVRTIHAGVLGIREDDEFEQYCNDSRGAVKGWVKIGYDPRRNETFVRQDTGAPVHMADMVILDQTGVWGWNVS